MQNEVQEFMLHSVGAESVARVGVLGMWFPVRRLSLEARTPVPISIRPHVTSHRPPSIRRPLLTTRPQAPITRKPSNGVPTGGTARPDQERVCCRKNLAVGGRPRR